MLTSDQCDNIHVHHDGGFAMTKSKDQKKQTKKEPSKTPKEKKEAKKLKKQERKV